MEFESYRDYLQLEKQYSSHTLKAYLDDLKSFSEFVSKKFEEKEIDSANYSMIRSWIVHLVDQGISNRSVNRKISSLQAYYNYLLKTLQIEVSPLVKHRSLKTAKKIQVPFSKKEVERARELSPAEGFEGVRNELIVTLFYATGIRRAELISIRQNDIQVERGELKVRGKGKKERIIPLLPVVLESLQSYLEERNKLKDIKDDEFLLLTKKGVKIYEMLVYRVIKDYFEKASTKTEISPHILRHTFATHLLNEGADINSIKSLLGHESLSTTQIYTHNDIKVLKEVHAKSHPRSNNFKK
ncbi:MAG TPA: tyrosine-type recombinase/integrase [Flavobacteriaceae bacterium]|nr:tyrosine-type recombinase/integrase [Flavobacteriaceae bacterium]